MKITREIKIVIAITILVISIYFLFKAFPISKSPIYYYKIFQDTNYKVYQEENEFMTQNFLDKDNVYLQELTRYIELDFLYYYNASLKTNIKYKYDIVSTLYIEYANTNQKIVQKDYPIIENKVLQKPDTNNISVEEKINMDYQTYYQTVQRFKERFNIPIQAYLVINFNIETGIESQEETNHISTSKVTIDLSKPVYEIKVQETKEQDDTILETQNINKNINYILLVVGGIAFVSSFSYLIYEIWKYQLLQSTKNKIRVRNILRKYSYIIVQLEKEPEFILENVIDVKEFNELINIEEEIREPILFYEKEDYAVFFIIGHNVIYRKIL